MAISGADGSIILTTAIDQKGFNKGMTSMKGAAAALAKSVVAITATATASVIALTKKAVDAYADYEQLVGGVETLFKGSADKVLRYAENAYKTAGLSSNAYMRNVTAFSASLLQSLGGDTEKAADVANDAIISIADNVNKMGSSYESVQLAFQGFAKQQYMLLDNLKLGYGGTKTEMERLLKDAQAITGVEYDISNLADVYTAIGIIQEKLGIAGTTAKEASTTISGSAMAMKSAWQNVLIAISSGKEIEKATDNLVGSVEIYLENLMPVIKKSLKGTGTLIKNLAPQLVREIISNLIRSIPELIEAVYEMIVGAGKGIYEGFKALFTVGKKEEEVVTDVGESADNASLGVNKLKDSIKDASDTAKKSLASFDDLSILANNMTELEDTNIDVEVEPIENIENVNVEETTQEVSRLNQVLETLVNDFLIPLKDTILPPINDSFRLLKSRYEKVSEAFEERESFQDFYTIAKGIWDIITKLVGGLLDFNNVSSNYVFNTAYATFEKVLQDTLDIIGLLAAVMRGDFDDAMQHVKNLVADNNIDFLESGFDSLIEKIEKVSPKTAEMLKNWKNNFSKWWNEDVNEWFSEIRWQELARTAGNAIIATVELLLNSVIWLANKAFDFLIKNHINNFIDAINSTIKWSNKTLGTNWDTWSRIEWEIPDVSLGRIEPTSSASNSSYRLPTYSGNEKEREQLYNYVNMLNSKFTDQNTTVVLEVDGREFGRAVVNLGGQENRRIGTSLVGGVY